MNPQQTLSSWVATSAMCCFLQDFQHETFLQKFSIVIGCTRTQVSGACTTWTLLQYHYATEAFPFDSFQQVAGHALIYYQLICHIKSTLVHLHIEPSIYFGHNFHIVGTAAGLTDGGSSYLVAEGPRYINPIFPSSPNVNRLC